MKKKLLTLMIVSSMAVSLLAGCSNSAKTDADLESTAPIESSDVTPSESATQESEASSESVAEEKAEAATYSVVITGGVHYTEKGYNPTAFAKDAEGNEYQLILTDSLSEEEKSLIMPLKEELLCANVNAVLSLTAEVDSETSDDIISLNVTAVEEISDEAEASELYETVTANTFIAPSNIEPKGVSFYYFEQYEQDGIIMYVYMPIDWEHIYQAAWTEEQLKNNPDNLEFDYAE